MGWGMTGKGHTKKYMATKMIDRANANWWYGFDRKTIFVWGKNNHKAILRVMQSEWFDGSFKLIPYSEIL